MNRALENHTLYAKYLEDSQKFAIGASAWRTQYDSVGDHGRPRWVRFESALRPKYAGGTIEVRTQAIPYNLLESYISSTNARSGVKEGCDWPANRPCLCPRNYCGASLSRTMGRLPMGFWASPYQYYTYYTGRSVTSSGDHGTVLGYPHWASVIHGARGSFRGNNRKYSLSTPWSQHQGGR
jgi:hypothetical protein